MSLPQSDNDTLDNDLLEKESHVQSNKSLSPSDDEWQQYNSWKERAIGFASLNYYFNLPQTLNRSQENLDMIRFLLKHDSTSVNCCNLHNVTFFMLAAADSLDAQGARLLYESGAKTGICDDYGRMALHFAANSGNPELLQFVLEHTDASDIEQWFMNVPKNQKIDCSSVYSFVGCAIRSRNVKCLEILLSSNKLSKSILLAPFPVQVSQSYSYIITSPVAYLLNLIPFKDEKLKSYLQLLLEHKMILPDEFFRVHKIKCPRGTPYQNPFTNVFEYYKPFWEQIHYFHWLNDYDITIDYCLQCFQDNTIPFAVFTDYKPYYGPVMQVIYSGNIEALKLIMSTSAILEPDELIIQFKAQTEKHSFPPTYRENVSKYLISIKYLISLKPIYYKQARVYKSGQDQLYPYSTVGEEFSESTLQQLCRTTIRHRVRGYSLEDNLRHFRKNILELPLPILLKDYLLFKSKEHELPLIEF